MKSTQLVGALLGVLLFGMVAQGEKPEVTKPDTMVLIPAGSFMMGDTFGEGLESELPVHEVHVSAFAMDRHLVTKALWDEVHAWASSNGYDFDTPGTARADDHPVHTVTWYDIVKWCNARSEKEGRVPAYYTSAAQTTVYRRGRTDVENDWVKWDANGYRLPTEAEWEKAARGGSKGKRFAWGNTISHSRANYWAGWDGSYDSSYSAGYHPDFSTGLRPYTSPVGHFPPNEHGLYDIAGNVWEWCWDWHSPTYYQRSEKHDPRGPALGLNRVIRGGGWHSSAMDCRLASRYGNPVYRGYSIGFRTVLALEEP